MTSDEHSGVGDLFAGRNNGRLRAGMRFADRCNPGAVASSVTAKRRATSRKHRVAELLADGLSTGQVAERLGITPRAVATYLRRLRDELGWQAQ